MENQNKEKQVLNKINLDPIKVVYETKLSNVIKTAFNNVQRYVTGTKGLKIKVTAKSISVTLLINPEANPNMIYNSHASIVPVKNKYSIEMGVLAKNLEMAGVIRPNSKVITQEIKDIHAEKGVSVTLDIDVETTIMSVLNFDSKDKVCILESIEPISERDAIIVISEYPKNRNRQRYESQTQQQGGRQRRKQRQSVEEVLSQIGV